MAKLKRNTNIVHAPPPRVETTDLSLAGGIPQVSSDTHSQYIYSVIENCPSMHREILLNLEVLGLMFPKHFPGNSYMAYKMVFLIWPTKWFSLYSINLAAKQSFLLNQSINVSWKSKETCLNHRYSDIGNFTGLFYNARLFDNTSKLHYPMFLPS